MLLHPIATRAAPGETDPEPEPQAGQQASSNAVPDARDRIYYPGDTEHAKPLARKLAGNILLDQKAIWTSPFRANRKNAGWWIGFTAATAALIATDHHTSTLLENSPGQVRWGNNVSRVGASYTLLVVDAAFYGAGVLIDNAKARETGVLGAEALIDGLIVMQGLKLAAGRDRPDSKEKGEFFNGGSSFPSGHSIESWALASIVAHEYSKRKWVPFVAYGLSTVVSAARFSAQKHFASDIVAGGAIGWFMGRYVYQTHQDHALHVGHHEAQITPLFQPNTRTYGVGLRLGQ